MLEYLSPCLDLEVADISPGRTTGLGRHFVRSWRTIKAIGLLFARRRKCNVLYHPVDGGAGLIYSVAIAAVAKAVGYSIFIHHHSFAYVDKRLRLMAMLARILTDKGTHIVLCDKMAEGLAVHYPIIRTYEISNVALLRPAPSVTRPSREMLRVGFLSNLIVEKGLDTSVELLRAAIAEDLPIELHIAGPPTDRRALELIETAQRELGGRIHYAGALYGENKRTFLEGLDVFIFPTRYINEAQPRVVIEALGHGLPTLTINRGCIASDIGCTGGLCLPQEADFVADALLLLRLWCHDRDLLRAANEAARERAVALHDKASRQLAGFASVIADASLP
jgi:glycosyltransferase involved in cell wall biosynthesis